MSMYGVRNDKGEWYDWSDMEFWPKDACAAVATGNQEDTERVADSTAGGHLVELIESPAKVVVSEAEGELWKRVYDGRLALGKMAIDYGQGHVLEVIKRGWTVKKPKRWNVKVPHVAHYVYRVDDDGLGIEPDSVGSRSAKLTAAEIEHYGLGDCEKVVVADSAKTTREVKNHD